MKISALRKQIREKGDFSKEERTILVNEEDKEYSNCKTKDNIKKDESIQVPNKTDNVDYRYKVLAVIMVIFAGFTFTGANVLQKWTYPGLDYLTLLFHRSITQTTVLGIYFLIKRQSILGPVGTRKWLCAQGTMGAVLLICIFIAVRNVPLGSASAIFFCTPIFTYLFSAALLEGEYFGAFRAIICSLMFSGVVLITRPEFMFNDLHSVIQQENHQLGNGSHFLTLTPIMPYYQQTKLSESKPKTLDLYLLVAFLVPVLSAIVSICTRKCKKVNICLVTFYFGLGSLFTSIAGLAFHGGGYESFRMTSTQWTSTVGIVTLGIAGNFLYTGAVKFMSPTKSNIFRSFEVILNSVLQYFLEGTKLYSTIYGGTVLLISAMILTGFEREIVQRVNKPWFGKPNSN
jgi:drug/metabolite transporter (DMT)-like permease